MRKIAAILAGVCLAAPWTLALAQDSADPFAPEGSPVDKENPPPPALPTREAITNKLRKIVIPSVEFPGVPADIAMEFLLSRSRELDRGTANPLAKGLNLVLRPDPSAGDSTPDDFGLGPLVEINLRDAPLGTVLGAVAKQLDKEAWIENRAFVIGSADQKPDPKAGKLNLAMPELESTPLPAIEFIDTPLDAAVDLLKTRYRQLAAKDGKELSVEFVGKVKVADTFGENYPRIRLQLQNVSLYDAFSHVAAQAGLELEVTEKQVRIVESGEGK